ncbi:SMI1/KNR4 family protein [Actinomadura alba]|uniref:SMI1/KNR4 family protein n=1 Tax=Actinomadura alba TaxID=406431 RepID=A0ABR7LT61_9ACTN|nr:SMI1/KNR4 family protein [Actinomadura alba]MBC6467955.1 SMI1/KNR4 family protein [Actinomadura alba]
MSEELSRWYRNLMVFGPFQPVRPDDLAELKSAIDGPLPGSYGEFIEVANGGSLQYSVRIPPHPEGEPILFGNLLSVAGVLTDYRRLPKTVFAEAFATMGVAAGSLLPIAQDGGGSMLFLDLSPDTHGRVLAFVFGLPDWTGVDRASGIGVVADDFERYLDLLFIDAGTAEATWEDTPADEPADPWRRTVEQWLDHGRPGWRDLPWAKA